MVVAGVVFDESRWGWDRIFSGCSISRPIEVRLTAELYQAGLVGGWCPARIEQGVQIDVRGSAFRADELGSCDA